MKTIEKISETGKVVTWLKDLITSGEIAEGERLPKEKELSQKLNVGISKVREALFILQVLGYVEISRGKVTFSKKIDTDISKSATDWIADHFIQMSDYMEARGAIETTAVKLAVQKARVSEIEQLEQIHKIFKKAVEDNDIVALVEADKTFHRTIIKATHNKVLSMINYTLERGFEKYRIEAFSIKKAHINSLISHRNIINAIKKRDAEAAQKAMILHFNIIHRDISELEG